MAFLIQCDNRGCLQLQAARLDINTNEVICMECSEPIKNVTHFAKVQLKSLGQTTKRAKATQTYSVKCDSCSIEDVPNINGDIFTCKSCKHELKNLSMPFKHLLKSVLNNEGK